MPFVHPGKRLLSLDDKLKKCFQWHIRFALSHS